MITNMEKDGRILIPEAIRSQAGLEAGVPLEVRVRGDRVEIELAYRPIELRTRGSFLVADAVDDGPVLTAEEVRRTIRELRPGPTDV